MSSILFGYTMSLTTAATPSTGFLVAYDSDGILKQKDTAGVITPIGGGSGSVFTGTGSLAQVLAVGNDSETHSILMGTATSILIGNSGTIDMASASTIYMGTASAILSNNGLGALYFDSNSATSSVLLTTGYNYLSLTNGTMSFVNSLSGDINITNNTNYLKLSTDVDVFSQDQIRLRLFNTSDEILIKRNIGLTVSSNNGMNNATFIATQNSTFSPNVVNSVILGGVGQSATHSESVYVPDLYIQDTKKIRGTLGNSSINFTQDNSVIAQNNDSLIGVVSSTDLFSLVHTGIIISDSKTTLVSPDIYSSPVFISTKGSQIDIGVQNAVVIGGENLVASLTNSVVLGQYVNINNQYTFPIIDGASGSYMVTDGFGNLTWTTSPAEVQNLEDVLTIGNWTGYNSIEMGTGSSLYSVRGGGQINLDYSPDSVVISTDNANLNKAYIQLDNDDIFLMNNANFGIGVGSASVIVANGEGLVYGFDYSATFVTYSLVHKYYVDLGTASIWSAIDSINNDYISEIVTTNGLNGGGTSGTVTLAIGGTLSQNTNIDGNNFNFTLRDADIITFTASTRVTAEVYDNTINGSLHYLLVDSGQGAGIWYDGQGTYSRIRTWNSGLQITAEQAGGSQSSISVSFDANQTSGDGSSNNTFIIRDDISQKGLVYEGDYLANFTTYSLITKEYVDMQITGSATSKYSETRSFTASLAETITHSLGTQEVIVQTYESGVMVIPGDVIIVDNNSVDIRFNKTISNIKIVIVG